MNQHKDISEEWLAAVEELKPKDRINDEQKKNITYALEQGLSVTKIAQLFSEKYFPISRSSMGEWIKVHNLKPEK